MIADAQKLKKILLPTDLSNNAEQAFDYAVSIADCLGARITVLHVMEQLPPNALLILEAYHGTDGWKRIEKLNEQEVIQKIRSRIEAFCAGAASRFPGCTQLVDQVILETGHPVERILHHASAAGCDLIVMGAKGHGLLKDALLGSTSERVLRRCHKPVLVVPKSDQ